MNDWTSHTPLAYVTGNCDFYAFPDLFDTEQKKIKFRELPSLIDLETKLVVIMGYKAKNKQGAPEPLEKPKFDGPSKRAKARLNKAKAAAADKKSENKKRQNTTEEPKKNNKKVKTSKAAPLEAPEEDLWDNLEVASDDNSDAENDEFDMSDFENEDSDNDDVVEEQEEDEEDEEKDEEDEVFPQAEGDFLGSDSEEEMELDQEEEEDDDEYDSDEIAEVL